jgi:hypothetical protein
MKQFTCRTLLLIFFLASFVLGTAARAQVGQEHSCTNSSLSGSFRYTSVGTLIGPEAGPFVQVGRQTFDGRGNTNATATTSVNGDSFSVTINGTYSVNPDCTGSMTLNVSPVGLTVHADFVITSSGAEFRAMVTDSGSAVTVAGKKQFRSEEPGRP